MEDGMREEEDTSKRSGGGEGSRGIEQQRREITVEVF
jgi:hypothetical protein